MSWSKECVKHVSKQTTPIGTNLQPRNNLLGMTDKHDDVQPDWDEEIFEAEGSKECPLCGLPYLVLVKSDFPIINHKPWSKENKGMIAMNSFLPQTGKKEDFYICPTCYEHDKEMEWPADAAYHCNLTEELLEMME